MTPPKTSQRDLLSSGGIYPVIVPVDWVLIDTDGNPEPLPPLPGQSVHRILARGALLATESEHSPESEVMLLRQYELPDRITSAVVNRYVRVVTHALHEQGVGPKIELEAVATYSGTGEPCGKVVLRRTAPHDRRVEIHYLLRDNRRQSWELVYLLRPDSLDRWLPLLDELEA